MDDFYIDLTADLAGIDDPKGVLDELFGEDEDGNRSEAAEDLAGVVDIDALASNRIMLEGYQPPPGYGWKYDASVEFYLLILEIQRRLHCKFTGVFEWFGDNLDCQCTTRFIFNNGTVVRVAVKTIYS
jgi:hypothetical protein